MNVPTHELLLALRAPTSGWLATLVCALDEALRDENFSPSQRALLQTMIAAGAVPSTVATAADQRMQQFEDSVHATALNSLDDVFAQLDEPADEAAEMVSSRPHLTLCVNTARQVA